MANANVETVTRTTVYFGCCGEANTESVVRRVREGCLELGIRTVVVASETGRSALAALEGLRGTGAQLVVVTHYPATTWGPRGDIPIGLMRREYSEIRETLLKNGARIVQGSRPLAPPSRSIRWDYPTPEAIMDKTLEVFGAGTKIAIEAAIIATDAGAVAEGDEIISCAGTYKGLDTALVVKTTYSMHFFTSFEVREALAKPRCRIDRLPEYEHESWKGDLEKYYSP
ncbi:MAG: hypothetical protein NUW12_02725 [Firmicutes bacterium]|jgi:hypothetical protein|nr:hypothetical protein [Bacillota bacterium]MDH7494639.1 pyruvate kinase alpha/beta domain-containing protein [Bacillota bacterium]